MTKTNKIGKVVLLLAMVAATVHGTHSDYLTRLHIFAGTPYMTLTCSRYIVRAHGGPKPHCGGAAGMWNGCNGHMEVVAQFASRAQINAAVLQAGDVLDFNGHHVAAFVGDGFMDSDPAHNGVARIDLGSKGGDLWFAGQVRILRWRTV